MAETTRRSGLGMVLFVVGAVVVAAFMFSSGGSGSARHIVPDEASTPGRAVYEVQFNGL